MSALPRPARATRYAIVVLFGAAFALGVFSLLAAGVHDRRDNQRWCHYLHAVSADSRTSPQIAAQAAALGRQFGCG